MSNKRKITHEGEIVLGDNVILCYVLEDGTRVLSERGIQEALKIIGSDESKQTSGNKLSHYLNQKPLKSFIYRGKTPDHYDPLECYKGNKKINSYEASVLIDICDAILEARNTVKLSPHQQIIAKQCDILIRGFAMAGAAALIAERNKTSHMG